MFDILRGATFFRALTHADDDAATFCDRIAEALWQMTQRAKPAND